MRQLIQTIVEAPKNKVEYLCHQLVLSAACYVTTGQDLPFSSNATRNFALKCQRYFQEIKNLFPSPLRSVQLIIDRFTVDPVDGFENSEEESQSFAQRETQSPNKARKPNPNEESIIQALLLRLQERELMLKQKRRTYCDTLEQFLNNNTPIEVWKAITELKGPFYFFEVFENQVHEGINYHHINKMMMCSKAYEREFEEYKRSLAEAFVRFQSMIKGELSKITQINQTLSQEPLCLVVKDEFADLKCPCDSRGIRLMLARWAFINRAAKMHSLKDVKSIVVNDGMLGGLRAEFERQQKQAERIVSYLKQQNLELLARNKELEQRISTLNQLEARYSALEQEHQRLQIEKGAVQIKFQQLESQLAKLKEMDRKIYPKLYQQSIEVVETQISLLDNIFKPPKQASIAINTDAISLDPTYNSMLTATFLLSSVNNSTQTEPQSFQLSVKQPTQQVIQQQNRFVKRQPPYQQVKTQGQQRAASKSNREPSPVFCRLFDDHKQKQARQSELSNRINDFEQTQWMEVLSLLNLLNDRSKNPEVKETLTEQIQFCQKKVQQEGQKLPQVKLKEKVPEYLIENMLKGYQKNKRVALNEMLNQFKNVLKVNKLSKSVDCSLQFTI